MEMSVNDAAEFFGVSKEAIHNRVRRGSLQVVLKEGVKMVVVDEKAPQTPLKQVSQRGKNTQTHPQDDRYYKFLEEQNAKLQERVEKLEGETRSLRDQKEQMLIEERQKIEAIYKEKDEQLKNLLSTLSQQFMLSHTQQIQDHDALDADVEIAQEVFQEEDLQELEPLKPSDAKIISLKKYIKNLNLSEKKAKELKKRFKNKAGKDRRIITLGEKIYLDTLRYDYSDLL